jgi:iron complex transport system ATP-binding protein
VIVVLHDLALAAQCCDSLVILKNGQVRALGTPDEVINSEYILDTYGVNVIVGRDVSTGLKYIVPDFQSNAESKSVN